MMRESRQQVWSGGNGLAGLLRGIVVSVSAGLGVVHLQARQAVCL